MKLRLCHSAAARAAGRHARRLSTLCSCRASARKPSNVAEPNCSLSYPRSASKCPVPLAAILRSSFLRDLFRDSARTKVIPDSTRGAPSSCNHPFAIGNHVACLADASSCKLCARCAGLISRCITAGPTRGLRSAISNCKCARGIDLSDFESGIIHMCTLEKLYRLRPTQLVQHAPGPSRSAAGCRLRDRESRPG